MLVSGTGTLSLEASRVGKGSLSFGAHLLAEFGGRYDIGNASIPATLLGLACEWWRLPWVRSHGAAVWLAATLFRILQSVSHKYTAEYRAYSLWGFLIQSCN